MRNRKELRVKARFLTELLYSDNCCDRDLWRKNMFFEGKGENPGLSFGSAVIKKPIFYPRTKYEDSEKTFILEIQIWDSSAIRCVDGHCDRWDHLRIRSVIACQGWGNEEDPVKETEK